MNLSGIKFSIVVFMILITACNDAKESVFSTSAPGKYSNELAEKIKSNPDGLTYTFNKYLLENKKEYLDLRITGSDFEANGLVLVNNWHKLEGIKRTKGQGYSGAELKGLKFDMRSNASGIELVYKDLAKIVD